MSEYSPELIRNLEDKAVEMRKDIVIMVGEAGCGPPRRIPVVSRYPCSPVFPCYATRPQQPRNGEQG